MRVRVTQALKGQLIAERLDPNVLISRFSEWKVGDEYSSYFFGKDALVLNTSVLRHVHMMPCMMPSNSQIGIGPGAEDHRRERPATDTCSTATVALDMAIF